MKSENQSSQKASEGDKDAIEVNQVEDKEIETKEVGENKQDENDQVELDLSEKKDGLNEYPEVY